MGQWICQCGQIGTFRWSALTDFVWHVRCLTMFDVRCFNKILYVTCSMFDVVWPDGSKPAQSLCHECCEGQNLWQFCRSYGDFRPGESDWCGCRRACQRRPVDEEQKNDDAKPSDSTMKKDEATETTDDVWGTFKHDDAEEDDHSDPWWVPITPATAAGTELLVPDPPCPYKCRWGGGKRCGRRKEGHQRHSCWIHRNWRWDWLKVTGENGKMWCLPALSCRSVKVITRTIFFNYYSLLFWKLLLKAACYPWKLNFCMFAIRLKLICWAPSGLSWLRGWVFKPSQVQQSLLGLVGLELASELS